MRVHFWILAVALITDGDGYGSSASLGQDYSSGLLAINEYLDNPYVQILDPAKWPALSGIGVLKRNWKRMDSNDREGHGTGVNISPCLIISSHHVVFGQRPYVSKSGFSFFTMSYNIGLRPTGFSELSKATPIIEGNLSTFDFTVLKDLSCPGLRFGWYETSNVTSESIVAQHADVLSASFPGDLGDTKLVISKGRVRGIQPQDGNVYYDASTAPGSSGSPVFIIDENGKLRLQGLHVGGEKVIVNPSMFKFPTYSEDCANEFVNITDLLDRPDVAAAIRLDLDEHPGPNPLEKALRVRA